MNPLSLLLVDDLSTLLPEERAALEHELSAAYHMDEAAAGSREVQRIAEKVRARLKVLAETQPNEFPQQETR